MADTRNRLESAAKICLGASLASLALMAVLVNAAFYSALADYWPVASLAGPAVIVAATLMAASFVLGLVLHSVVVVKGRRQAIAGTEAVRAQPDVRHAA